MIRYEERARCGLHHNLAIEKVRAKDEAVNALMQPSEQLAADFEGRGPVRSAVLHSRKGESNLAHLFEGYTRCWVMAPRCALR